MGEPIDWWTILHQPPQAQIPWIGCQTNCQWEERAVLDFWQKGREGTGASCNQLMVEDEEVEVLQEQEQGWDDTALEDCQ